MTHPSDGGIIGFVGAVILMCAFNYYYDGVLARTIQPVMDPLISAVFTW